MALINCSVTIGADLRSPRSPQAVDADAAPVPGRAHHVALFPAGHAPPPQLPRCRRARGAPRLRPHLRRAGRGGRRRGDPELRRAAHRRPRSGCRPRRSRDRPGKRRRHPSAEHPPLLHRLLRRAPHRRRRHPRQPAAAGSGAGQAARRRRGDRPHHPPRAPPPGDRGRRGARPRARARHRTVVVGRGGRGAAGTRRFRVGHRPVPVLLRGARRRRRGFRTRPRRHGRGRPLRLHRRHHREVEGRARPPPQRHRQHHADGRLAPPLDDRPR